MAGQFQHIKQFRKVGMKKPVPCVQRCEALLGEFKVARISIKADQESVWFQSLGDGGRVPGPAKRAVDDRFSIGQCERIQDFGK